MADFRGKEKALNSLVGGHEENEGKDGCNPPTSAPSSTPSPGGDVVSGYSGSDGIVQRSEAVQAVIDYFGGVITKQEAVSVVMAYFGG